MIWNLYKEFKRRNRPFSYSENIELFTVSKRDELNQATIIGMYKIIYSNQDILKIWIWLDFKVSHELR